MENYIVINGKKAELTKEQLETLGISPGRNNPFNDNLGEKGHYYYISSCDICSDVSDYFNQEMIKNANSFNDKEFAKEIFLRQLLYRKLEKYAWDNGAEDVEWNKCKLNYHYTIVYDVNAEEFTVTIISWHQNLTSVYFSSREIAEKAIENVVKPFMKEHPNFKW